MIPEQLAGAGPTLGEAAGSATALASAPASPVVRAKRFRTWFGILTAYLGSQTLTQLLGIAAGILFVRYMPVGDFALYTLGSSVITFLAFTTDLGSTTSLVHFYHRALKEGDDFGNYLAAVMSLRRLAFTVAAVLVSVAFPIMAIGKGFAGWDVTLATVAVLVAVGFQISGSVRVLALRLESRYGASYRAELAGAALRLLLALALVGSALLRSWLALAVAAAGSALTGWMARRGGERTAAARPGDAHRYRRAVIRYMLPTLPSALYFSIQGPLVVWLAATFGASRNIAEVGALGRLGLVVGLFGGLTAVVFVPRLAGITDEGLWRRRALQFGAIQLAIATSLVAAAAIAPGPFLWVLGGQYSALTRELALVVTGAGLTLLGGYMVALNMARAWNRWQPVAMLILMVTQFALIKWMRLDTTAGLLTFNALSAVTGLVLQSAIAVVGSARPRLVATT